MKKILFFIRSLNAGGAERQLVITAKGLAERGYKVTVLTFYEGGFYAEELKDTKVQLLSLHKTGRWDVLSFLLRLRRVLCQQKPDIIYSFLNTANILAVLLRPFIRTKRVVWGVRASNMDLDQYDWLSRWSYWLECRLARFADTIIANSYAGKDYAVAHGFPEEKISVIHNGIDTERFIPDKASGKRLRDEWGVGNNQTLIGAVGRIDPMKGIPLFLKAAAIVKEKYPKVRFVWVGKGNATYEQSMHKLATKMGLDDVLTWAGRHTDMVAVYNAFDIASSSSFGEGFPNVIGEAMACGVPCVVTDVGDSAWIVGEAGLVVGAGDSKAFSKAWEETIVSDIEDVETILLKMRERIMLKFSISMMLESTEQLICRVTGASFIKW